MSKEETQPVEAAEVAPVEQNEQPADKPSTLELSDDPVERAGQMAQAMKEVDPNAPPAEMLLKWKQKHGEIFVLPYDDKTYVYRGLKRQEWAQMNMDESFQNMNPLQTEEHIVQKCLLYPKINPMGMGASLAGLFTSLSEQIRIHSMFLNPEALAMRTIKL
jgi:hypothetical protein